MSDLDIWEEDGEERIGCTWCGGDGFEECTDTLAGCGPRCTGEICPCTGCHGKGYDQWVW